ncbi:MAG: hypothetical protein KGJ86_00585 [Chloroflexota bacterium]|nr:hypothetical protein [Chloroflexota bacterium]
MRRDDTHRFALTRDPSQLRWWHWLMVAAIVTACCWAGGAFVWAARPAALGGTMGATPTVVATATPAG